MTLRVLSVASECVPLVKTGGLADVVGALPGALKAQDVDMRVAIPSYPGVEAACDKIGEVVWREPDLIGGPGELVEAEAGGVMFLLLRAAHFFERTGGIYAGTWGDYFDNPQRFAALCWAAAAVAEGGLPGGWKADVLHAHDWQGGLAPAYLHYRNSKVKSVFTIHNIAFQGTTSPDRIPWLRLPSQGFNPDGYEYWGQISTLKAGLATADKITTVSPEYAAELLRPEFGMGMEGLLTRRVADFVGILNGADTALWDPSLGGDPAVVPFSAKAPEGKAANRAALISEFGLGEVPGPLCIVVSRLTWQKGIDLIPPALPDLLAYGGGLVVLGSGEPALEKAMQDLAWSNPARVAVRVGYDEALSRRMFAGGDAVLVPSRFEPCGLTQMYGLRFGTVPVVAATGGLADTVIHANPAALAAGVATGLTFHPTDAVALTQALHRLCKLYEDPEAWRVLQTNAMRAEVGWEASAAAYAQLYRDLVA